MRTVVRRLLVITLLLCAAGHGQSRQQPQSACKAGTYNISGMVKKGATFSRPFGGFVFALVPIPSGWMIDISQDQHHYLANLTPPRHFVPNPIEIEGWHFRNAANTGPSTGDVNAPGEHREFFFSPKFGGCISDPDGSQRAEFVTATRDGTGALEIEDLQLGNLGPGEKANIEAMKFTVRLTVAASAQPCRSKGDAAR